jgi:hypothetical protein
MGEVRNLYRVLIGKSGKTIGEPNKGGRIILKYSLS